MTLRYKTIDQFSRESGYTQNAIRSKIRDGVWLQDRVWIKAPDGRVLIDVEGYYAWVELGLTQERPAKRSVTAQSPAPLKSRPNGGGSPPPLV